MENTFEKNFNDYISVRPSYPKSLFRNFSQYCQLSEKSDCLEIGAGHGIATEIINSLWKPQIIALEPGESLYKYAKARLNKFHNIQFIQTTFEEYIPQKNLDCIYAATSFHWINPTVKFQKSWELLKSHGILFLFWNYFDLKDPDIRNEIQEIYEKYHPKEYKAIDQRKSIQNKINSRKEEIDNSGYFTHLNHFEIRNPIRFSANQYVKLLKTFPNNSYPELKIRPFFEAVRRYIKDNGNSIEVEIRVCSEIARKK